MMLIGMLAFSACKAEEAEEVVEETTEEVVDTTVAPIVDTLAQQAPVNGVN